MVISDNGTAATTNDDVLIFTRTSGSRGAAHLYWTVSDGTLNAQCVATGYDLPPGNG
ncbi:hypothetical protein [Micromonospora sp. LOL_015]|uniref:hypothetical protein n=1 Tax=Micromonospora sp. LOL_015 TaxID=3345416 RepID=UPI003A85F297